MKNKQNREQTGQKNRLFPLAAPARRILALGLPPIFAVALWMWFEVERCGCLTAGAVRYFGGMLEYPLAALMLLTGGALLADLAAKRGAPHT